MKQLICVRIGLILMLGGLCVSCNREDVPASAHQEKIVLHSSPDVYELTREWAGVFCKLNPEVDIEVLKTSGSTIAENLTNTSQQSFVTSDFESGIYDRTHWKVIVGRDIIVPVINARNPYIEEICKQGISPAGLARILNNPVQTNWNTLFEKGPDVAVNLYIKNDPSLYSGIARFLETKQVTFSEQNIVEPEALLTSMQSEKFALGICYLTDLIDPGNQEMYENLRILPIDRNGNGFIDYKEDVYASLDAFARGAWIGKYPKNLVNNLYTLASSTPDNESELAFLEWVITRGHVLLNNHGFGDLPEFERLAQVKFIKGIRDGRPGPGVYSIPKEPGFFTSPLPYILAFLLLLSLLLYYSIRRNTLKKEGLHLQEAFVPGVALDDAQFRVAPGLYYDKTHTWAFMEEDGTVKVGIDDFLQRVTGPLTRVRMKPAGERVKKGKKALSIIQNGKQLDIYAPVSGTIKAHNPDLSADATLLNTSPYTKGWIYKIEPVNWFKEVQFLIMGNSYKKWLKKELQRLKEFLADTLRSENPGYAHVLQDGGEIKNNILKDLGPETWEDFQTNFMDVS